MRAEGRKWFVPEPFSPRWPIFSPAYLKLLPLSWTGSGFLGDGFGRDRGLNLEIYEMSVDEVMKNSNAFLFREEMWILLYFNKIKSSFLYMYHLVCTFHVCDWLALCIVWVFHVEPHFFSSSSISSPRFIFFSYLFSHHIFFFASSRYINSKLRQK